MKHLIYMLVGVVTLAFSTALAWLIITYTDEFKVLVVCSCALAIVYCIGWYVVRGWEKKDDAR